MNHDTWFWCIHLLKSKVSLIYSREPLSHEASIEGGSHETDFTDHGPGVDEPLPTGTQVTSLRSELGLNRDGAFLDPEKYDPIQHLGTGGFAEVYLVKERKTDKKTACKMFDLRENHKDIQKVVLCFS